MSNPTASAAGGQQLSELIYVELLGRAFLRVENAASFKPEAAALAKLSIDLEKVFHEAERQAAAEESSKKNVGYQLGADDLTSWVKK
jgi:hypothetical protein